MAFSKRLTCDSQLVTSVWTKRALGSSSASFWPPEALRSAITTWQPTVLRARTYASPRPLAPPVTMAVLPLRWVESIGVEQSMGPVY